MLDTGPHKLYPKRRGAVAKANSTPSSFIEPDNLHRKIFQQGTHRSRDPKETLAIIESFFPVFGITRVANVTGLDNVGIPVVMVVRPNSRSLSVSQGKGTSLIAAKVSGIMESIESWHAETIEIPTRLLNYSEMLTSHRCINTSQLPVNRDRILSPNAKIPWVKGCSLLGGTEIWVPYEVVHSDYTYPYTFDSGYFISDSNGLASGNCLTEAINHGVCEVIERDALTLWSLKSKTERDQTRLDLESIEDADCVSLIQHFLSSGIKVAVWDVTSDIDVPVYVCKIMQPSQETSGIRPAMGAGCHPSKGVALSRALTEAAQSRLTFISGARDDQLRHTYASFQTDEARSYWLAEVAGNGTVNFTARQSYSGAYLEDDLLWLLSKLEKAGIREAAFVDLTKAEFGISVVRVVIPGLECHTMSDKRIPGPRAMEVINRRKAAKKQI